MRRRRVRISPALRSRLFPDLAAEAQLGSQSLEAASGSRGSGFSSIGALRRFRPRPAGRRAGSGAPDPLGGDQDPMTAAGVLMKTERVRLRPARLPEDVEVGVPWYRDPEVLRLSEGEGTAAYDRKTVQRMYEFLAGNGELYVIEVRDTEEGTWRPIGDAALCRDSVPIVIGERHQRSRGIGTEVLSLLLERARQLGWNVVNVKGVYAYNERALRLFQRAGFVETSRHADQTGYELKAMQ